MPKAINTVIVRIAVFYVGSLVLLSLLLPFTSYKAAAHRAAFGYRPGTDAVPVRRGSGVRP
jgi:L-asparagine transporter-like permease